jgi:hypothetical protein
MWERWHYRLKRSWNRDRTAAARGAAGTHARFTSRMGDQQPKAVARSALGDFDEKAGGRADLILQLPARGSGSAAILRL